MICDIMRCLSFERMKVMNTNTKTIGQGIQYLEDHTYTGSDLGLTYSKQASTFKVWSPLAESVELNLYGTGDVTENSLLESISLELRDTVWQVTVHRDLKGLFYTYRFVHNGIQTEAPDLYSTAVGVNGDRTAIVDLIDTNPKGWEMDQQVMQPAITDAVIWETHVADFSTDPNSGISEKNQGKYLAFTEKESTLYSSGEVPTCMNHVRNLGANYIHLLPIFDFANEEQLEDYNWGYDPKNYMVPEGRYSTDPTNPIARIKECKQMIQSIHESNIGVVLDVVYNHTYETEHSWFQYTVPNYYYRQNADGSFADGSACGNETASERKMMRKYMVDSILYWAKEYHVDGFRFDLMGLHDVETMNTIRKSLDEAGFEDIILYGEPWNGGSVAIHEPNKPADKFHIQAFNDGIAVFNDEFRDAIKGSVFEEHKGGFLQGANGQEGSDYSNRDLIASIVANTEVNVGRFFLPEEKAWAQAPRQVITYGSSHDNLSLYDKLVLSMRLDRDFSRHERLIRINKIFAALLYTSQGALFMQAGEEFARTKYGDENSYQSSIAVNRLDWARIKENQDLVDYYKGMSAIRKAYPPLRDATKATADHIVFSQLPENVLTYTIPNIHDEDAEWKMMAVAVNTNSYPVDLDLRAELPLPKEWTILANSEQAGLESLGKIKGNHLIINPKDVLVLVG